MTVKIMPDVLSQSSGFLSNIVYFSTTLDNLPSVFIRRIGYGFTYGAEDGVHNKSFNTRKKIGYIQVPKYRNES
jgi:hypothetical protein